MGETTLLIIAYGLTAASANFLGGLFVSSRKLGQGTLRYLIAIGAGFLLAAVFLKMVPASIELWAGDVMPAMLAVLAGYLILQLVEHTMTPHFHFGEETHEQEMLAQHAAVAGVGALMVHAFLDGVSIAVASLVNPQLGFLVFVAILLHKLPEGFTVASMMLAAGRGRRKALLAAFMLGAATLAGVVLLTVFQGLGFDSNSRPLSAYALPLSAGVTLYIAASDLIPEVNTRQGGLRTSLLVFAGVALFYLTDHLLDLLGLGH